MRTVIERRWSSHPVNVHHARVVIREVARRYVDEDIDMVELAIGEACANAIEHGSPCGEENTFLVRCLIAPEQKCVIFEVEDEGADFSIKDLSLGHVPDSTSEGGRGLFLINQIMDEVALHNSPTGLMVRMVKHVRAWPADD
jgi:anti-sigma regulatory factor (Ser/Thr protein kinase)